MTATWHRTLRALGLLLGLAAALGAAPAHAARFDVAFTNVHSTAAKGSADNTTFTYTLSPGAYITGFSWTADVTAFDPSWLSELTLEFTNALGEGVQISPAGETEASGSFTSSGSLDLVNSGLGFRLQPDGRLHLEFFEGFDDLADAPDGRWNSASLSFEYVAAVPEPASVAMLSVGLLALGACAKRRRRERPGD